MRTAAWPNAAASEDLPSPGIADVTITTQPPPDGRIASRPRMRLASV